MQTTYVKKSGEIFPLFKGQMRCKGSGLSSEMGAIHVAYMYDSVFFLRDNFNITKAINRTPRAERYRKEEQTSNKLYLKRIWVEGGKMCLQQQESLKEVCTKYYKFTWEKGFYFSQCGKTQRFQYFVLKEGKGQDSFCHTVIKNSCC